MAQDDDASFFTAVQQQQQRLYCGDKPLLPQGYTDFGSRRVCLRKGVGVGLAISRQKGPTAANKYKNKTISSLRPWYYGIPWWVWLSLLCLLILLILVLVLIFRRKKE